MMKRLFSLLTILLFAGTIYAQSCYNETRSRGISLYNKGQYANAIKAFEAAKSCPDKPVKHDLDNWISKCRKGSANQNNQNKQTDTYIRINNKGTVTANFDSSGGTETFTISTDAHSWSTWGVPSWCTIESKTATKLVLKVNENLGSTERSDFMEVRTSKGYSARLDIKQSANPNGVSATIENVNTSNYDTIDGEEGMTIQFKLKINGMKDKNASVVAYFYDNDGNALKDTNDKYATTKGNVCAYKDITPSYEKSSYNELKITIPYSELHLSTSGYNTIKFHLEVWDESQSTAKSISRTGTFSNSFNYTNSVLLVDGSASDKTKNFPASGGRETYYVRTSDSSFETWGIPTWCSVENKTSTSFTLVCNANTTTVKRSDYMKVKAAGKEIRIDITQDAPDGPTANIKNMWVEHNVFNNGTKGMKVHINLDVNGMKGQTVKYCLFFYKKDNTTKLVNSYGSHISASATDTSPYDSTNWSDWWLFIPNATILGASNSDGQFSFDVEIQNINGKLLTRRENYQLSAE